MRFVLRSAAADPLLPRQPHFAAKAKNVIFLFMAGGPSETLVVWGGEFGRTPMYEMRRMPGTDPDKAGRDHHPFGYTMLLGGGGIKGGQVVGRTDELGYHAVEDRVHVHDLQATILHCLGIDHTKLTYRHQGRDFRLTDVHGEVVKKLLV